MEKLVGLFFCKKLITRISLVHKIERDKRSNKMTFFQHIRFSCGGAVTIAVAYNGNDTASAGYAWCSPGDNFCRAKGRLLAEGRMVSKKYSWCVPVDSDKQNSLLKSARDFLASQPLLIWPCRSWAEEAFAEFVTKNGGEG